MKLLEVMKPHTVGTPVVFFKFGRGSANAYLKNHEIPEGIKYDRV